MKLKEFEQAIIAKGLKPKEVRLEHSNVKWFVCAPDTSCFYRESPQALIRKTYQL